MKNDISVTNDIFVKLTISTPSGKGSAGRAPRVDVCPYPVTISHVQLAIDSILMLGDRRYLVITCTKLASVALEALLHAYYPNATSFNLSENDVIYFL